MTRLGKGGTAACIALLMTAGTGCTNGEDEARTAAEQVAESLTAVEVGVPLDGTTTEDAQDELDRIAGGLTEDEAAPTVTVGSVTLTEEEQARVALRWAWDLPGTGRTWRYDTEAVLVERDDEWRLRWSPRVVEPSLRQGEALELAPMTPRRGDVLGADDARLVTDRPVFRFGLDKANTPPAEQVSSARDLARLLDVDSDAFADRVEQAGKTAFVEALVLREEDVTGGITNRYRQIPGAVALADEIPLAPTRDFARAMLGTVGPVTAEMVEEPGSTYRVGDEAGLSGLQQRYDESLRGKPGLTVEASTAEGEDRELFTVEAEPGTDLRTTLDPSLQLLAEELLAGVAPPSALVAVRPSDGAVLVAASGPGSEGLNTATAGQYAPGSTFKVVSALALLRSGLGTGSAVTCPRTTVVDGKSFKNYDDYPTAQLGRITLTTALASSCNTAFITEEGRVDDAALTGAAADLGLGVDHDLGFPAYFGSVPSPGSETEKAASMIGQGKVLASPMAMAAVAASVAEGRTVVPYLLPESRPSAPTEAGLSPGEARALGAMMRETVARGSGAQLSDVPGEPVLAKTGTAEYGTGDPLPTHAWMIAAKGDLAVAVFVERGESGSRTAGPILEEFLRNAR
jgi:cell division protein FtsI/penicillin-binding protein 2